ncbi:MAG: ABC transporter permease [Chloroflexi bacterium]|nr:MAG: ABC transporter permease [Chloroflexota bacterium]
MPFRVLRVVLFYLALLGLWQVVAMLHVWPKYVLPPPNEVWDSFWTYLRSGRITDAVEISMRRLLIGYFIGLVAGVLIGMAMANWKWVDETLGSAVLGLQSLPSVTWVPLAVIWFGINDKAIIFVVVMGSVASIAISARSGMQQMPPIYKRAALTMGASRLQTARYVQLPALLPSMTQGLKLGWSFAWRSLMAAELIVATVSLGQLLDLGRSLNDMSLVLAVMLVIVAIGLFVDFLVFGRIERFVQERWGLAT